MSLKIRQQKSSDGKWVDESGNLIPYDRVKSFERLNERKLAGIARAAVNINRDLTKFKEIVFNEVQALYAAFIADNGGKAPGKGKGGSTFYNFDRTIKAEVRINEQIVFDENLIALAEAKLNELLNDGLSDAKEFIKPLVMDAFKTSGGKLDTKRVLGLRRYADRISDPRYAEAMAFIDKAIRKPESRQYFQVWLKNEKGEYQDIQLNFSAI